MKEIESQGICDYELWNGVFLPSVKASINAAHRQVVEYARLAGWDEVCIAEDDFRATNPGSWEYYLSRKPSDFDIYLSMVYLGDIADGRVRSFTGMTLYTVSKKFYDIFLNVDPQEHIDRALSGLGDYRVCEPFPFVQHNGYSSNTGKMEEYDSLLSGRKLFCG